MRTKNWQVPRRRRRDSLFVPDSGTGDRKPLHARLNPFTAILEAARGFLAGDPTNVAFAFTVSAALVFVLAIWAVFGLRRAEKAG